MRLDRLTSWLRLDPLVRHTLSEYRNLLIGLGLLGLALGLYVGRF